MFESKSYNSDGALASWNVTAYDDKGNEIESVSKKANGSVVNKSIYSYEFDFAGNWVRRNISILVDSGGQLYFEPYGVMYRTITYY